MLIPGWNAERAAGQEASAPSPKLVRAAHEFEGQMMQVLFKPLSESDGLGGGEDDSGSESTLGDFASQALGQALSQQGGLGIANKIVRELSHFGKQHDAGKVTGNLHGGTAIRGAE